MDVSVKVTNMEDMIVRGRNNGVIEVSNTTKCFLQVPAEHRVSRKVFDLFEETKEKRQKEHAQK